MLPAGLAADATALSWLGFLSDRAGRRGARAALRYYRRLDWLGERAEEGLVSLLDGVAEPGAEPRVRAEADGGVAGLTPADHRRSLAYLEALSDRPVDGAGAELGLAAAGTDGGPEADAGTDPGAVTDRGGDGGLQR